MISMHYKAKTNQKHYINKFIETVILYKFLLISTYVYGFRCYRICPARCNYNLCNIRTQLKKKYTYEARYTIMFDVVIHIDY